MVGIRTKELAAIFFATFENVRGTVIAYQYPATYVSQSQFKEISNAVLPRAELAFRVITVEAFQHYVIGCPQRIEGLRYQRNTLQFNICLVIKPNPCHILDDITGWQFATDQHAGGLRLPIQLAYEALALKINRFFYTLEEDCAFLSKCLDESTGEWGESSMPCLDAIFQQLHADGMCVYPFENSGSLYLRFSPQILGSAVGGLSLDDEEIVSSAGSSGDEMADFEESTVIRNHQTRDLRSAFTALQPFSDRLDDSAFVLVDQESSRKSNGSWLAEDYVSYRLLPHIDGTHNLLELAHLSHVDVSMVRMCLANLIQQGVVRTVPTPTFLKSRDSADSASFPITNAGWLGMPRLAVLLSDTVLGNACLESVLTEFPEDFNQPDVRFRTLVNIFRVYTILCGSPNFSLSHLLSATPFLRFVDLPKPQDGTQFVVNSSVNFGDRTTLSIAPSQQLSVSLLRLVHFGEVNGLIHRIHCYPINDKTDLNGVGDVSSQDSSRTDHSNQLAAIARTSNHPSSHSTLSPLHSSGMHAVLTSGELDEKTWSAVRSTVLDGLHSVDGICSRLTQDLCLLGATDSQSASKLFSQLSDSFMHRLRTKSLPHNLTTRCAEQNSSTSSSRDMTLPFSWTQPPLPPLPYFLKRANDSGFKPATTSTDEPVSSSRSRSNPLNRSGASLQRRMSSIPHGCCTGDLRSLVERHGLDDKAHNADRKTNKQNLQYLMHSSSVPTLYTVWR